MANNPVQIVLNAQNYVQIAEIPPGGGNKDFFAGRDSDFKRHKDALAQSLDILIPSKLAESPLIFAHVELQETAWAKSHRPVNQVFPKNKIRSTPGNTLGTLIVELAPSDIKSIRDKILSAENETHWDKASNSEKLISKPSRLRSEVGAIKEIRLYSDYDRRKFSIKQAVQWLSDPRTGGAYYIDTFIPSDNLDNTKSKRATEENYLLEDLMQGIKKLELPIEISKLKNEWANNQIFIVQIKDSDRGRIEVHKKLISYIDSHPIVRAILLPPVIQSSNTNSEETSLNVFPSISQEITYPVVGIIDTGVSFIDHLKPWQAGAVDFIDPTLQDTSHGTFIAGLIAGGKHLNPSTELDEADCKFYDLGLHPTYDYESYYPRGFFDFLEQLDAELITAVQQGVRVFNMSLSVTLPIEDSSYSLFANILDQIADRHDIIFVLPSGNLDGTTARGAWPDSEDQCLKLLAEYRYQGKDKIFQPADSVRSITVGALDPADKNGTLKPSRYTRRGPGPSLGAKPDVAHIGGRLEPDHGLYSLTPKGGVSSNCGTSFASPLVAKNLATLNHLIEGYVPRETLSALLIHNSKTPDWMTSKKLFRVAKDFVGAGVPNQAARSLEIDDNQITLVFNGVLKPNHELVFDFTWPACLVKNGACTGKVKVTTVYSPAIDINFGAEFILTNIDTWLRQEVIDKKTGEVSFKGRLKSEKDKSIEKERIAHGAKWWPVKTIETTFPRGVGESSQWRLVLEPLNRNGFTLPEEGVPFSTIMTISDPKGNGRVFDETRQQLQASGVEISDIRTALSSRLRQEN